MQTIVLRFALMTCLVGVAGALQQASSADQQVAVIDVTAIKPVVTIGSPVELQVRLTNTSDHDINASASYDRDLNISYQYSVRTEGGLVLQPRVPTKGRAITGTSKIRNLQPGESAEDMTNIGDEYEFTSPGKYFVRVSRGIAWDTGNQTVKSNEVVITIAP